MRILPLPPAAIRMAILIGCVAALDAAAVFVTAKQRLWCALIPILIPALTPAIIFSHRARSKA